MDTIIAFMVLFAVAIACLALTVARIGRRVAYNLKCLKVQSEMLDVALTAFKDFIEFHKGRADADDE